MNYPEFADDLEESSDPSSAFYKSISLSWEVGYDNYNILVGSKNIKDGELITDEKKVKELSQYLSTYGGQDKLPDGTPCYLIIDGDDVAALGFGFVDRPAAEVSGVITQTCVDMEECTDKNDSSIKKINNIKEKSSLSTNIHVKDNDMKKTLKSFSDIASLTDETVSEYSIASINEVIENEIKRVSEDFSRKTAEQESAAAEAKAMSEKLSQEVASLSEKLSTVLAEQAKIEKQNTFNDRMTLIDSEYDLDNEDKTLVATEIKDLDQAGFEKWYTAFARWAKSKKKVAEAQTQHVSDAISEEDVQKRIDEAVTQALHNAKENGTVIPNTTEDFAKTLRDQYKNAFGKDGIIVKH